MAWETSGVPGARTRTSWFDRDLPAMWRVLENQQSDDHWRLVAGWRKAAELTALHVRRLEQYRANLTDAWPPDRNTAAAAYVSRLDFLIQSVRATHDTAAANYSTLAATVGALAAARHDLKPLYDEYLAKSQAMKSHAQLAALNAASEAPTVIGAAPAKQEDLERLNNRARAIMYSLSHTLVEAEAAIRQPPVYPSGALSSPVDPDVYGEPYRAQATGLEPRHGQVSESVSPRDPGGGVVRSSDDVDNSIRTSPVGRLSDPEAGSGHAPIFPSSRSPEKGRSSTSRGSERPTIGASKGMHILPVGGVIGPTPGGNPPPTPRTARVNPVGGLIESYHNGSTSGTGSGTGPLYGAMGRAPRKQKSTPIARPEPETQWPTAEGVTPVIEPPKIPANFDPGPTIGIDR